MGIEDSVLSFIASDTMRNLIWAVILACATAVASKVVKRALHALLDHPENPLPASSLIINIGRGVVWVIGGSIILQSCFGINPNALVTALGVGGVALSLGLQDTLSNLIGGIQMTLMGVVRPGDNIEIGSETGVVTDVGLRHTTIITKLGDKKVTSSVSLPMLVSAMRPGDKAELTVIRDKKEIVVPVTIGTNSGDAAASDGAAANAGAHQLGVQIRPLTDDESRSADTTGLLVMKSSGLAAKSGIRTGDIIVSANGKLVKSVEDLRAQCTKDQVLLLVQRDGGRIFVPIRFKDEAKK